MQDFMGKVAVVTGAASGIGRAIAERCAQEGMKVVLADVEAQALDQAENALRGTGASVLAVRTDVSKVGDVEELARQTVDAFGGVHLLFNNAGVNAIGKIWEATLADWEWVMGVNLWGAIHGIRAFVPIMLAQETECHVVNTSSVMGLLPYHPSAPYLVTKHAVVALTEHLYHSLAQANSKVKASVLCPGWVKTQLVDSERNRPLELQNPPSDQPLSPELAAAMQWRRDAIAAGMAPQEVAGHVFDAIRAEQLYILIAPAFTPQVQQRMENILQQRNPVLGN
jgi:NAD(P)-dependent dehydrogenase (short-subunit alcohol dehydrogenase family)